MYLLFTAKEMQVVLAAHMQLLVLSISGYSISFFYPVFYCGYIFKRQNDRTVSGKNEKENKDFFAVGLVV